MSVSINNGVKQVTTVFLWAVGVLSILPFLVAFTGFMMLMWVASLLVVFGGMLGAGVDRAMVWEMWSDVDGHGFSEAFIYFCLSTPLLAIVMFGAMYLAVQLGMRTRW